MISRTVSSIVVVLLACSSARADDIRRVVTGLDDNNKAIVLFDSRLALNPIPGPYGIAATNLWITASYPPGLSSEDTASTPVGVSPLANGTKFRVVEFPPLDPATEAKLDPDFIMKGVNPVPARGLPVKHPLMHRTRSLDYAVVLSGEIEMMLDNETVRLKPGDVVVQQATNHGWINHGAQPCRILFVLMDSKEP
jgi:mannose-6-phosphate isomerase-like protein (cupin superfamily)